MAERTLFARKATGLVREIGFTTAVILAIANVVGAGWQRRVFQSIEAESVPSTDYFLGIHPMIMAFFLVGILMLLSIYTFMVLSAAMPRSGGGYVFMSRILSPGFSFMATCLEFFFHSFGCLYSEQLHYDTQRRLFLPLSHFPQFWISQQVYCFHHFLKFIIFIFELLDLLLGFFLCFC